VRHRGSRGRGVCACVVLVVYAKVRAHANAPSFDVVVFFHLQEFGYKVPKSFFVPYVCLKILLRWSARRRMERTTANKSIVVKDRICCHRTNGCRVLCVQNLRCRCKGKMVRFLGSLLSLIWSRCASRRWPPKALGGLGHRRAQTNLQVAAPYLMFCTGCATAGAEGEEFVRAWYW